VSCSVIGALRAHEKVPAACGNIRSASSAASCQRGVPRNPRLSRLTSSSRASAAEPEEGGEGTIVRLLGSTSAGRYPCKIPGRISGTVADCAFATLVERPAPATRTERAAATVTAEKRPWEPCHGTFASLLGTTVVRMVCPITHKSIALLHEYDGYVGKL
jgi:hypothetical protein